MITVDALKHNRYQKVDVPRASELYKRFGYTTPKQVSGHSGEEFLDPTLRKTDVANQVLKEVNSPEAAAEPEE